MWPWNSSFLKCESDRSIAWHVQNGTSGYEDDNKRFQQKGDGTNEGVCRRCEGSADESRLSARAPRLSAMTSSFIQKGNRKQE